MEITVNGSKISAEVFSRELAALKANNHEKLKDEELEDIVKTNLVDREIIRQEAEKADFPVTEDEIDKEFERVKQMHGGAENFYRKFNLTREDDKKVRTDIKIQLSTAKYLHDLSNDVSMPAEDAVKKEFEANRDRYIVPETIHAAHIVKNVSPPTAAQVYQEMLSIRSRLKDGAEFKDEADKLSDCNDQGGDLGTFGRGKMVEAFDVVAFSMDEGEISPVFQTQFGYHIVKVYKKYPSRQQEFSEAKDNISNRLHYDMRNDKIAQVVDGIKEKAEIEYGS